MTVRRLLRFSGGIALRTAALSRNALAITVPPSGPRPLLLRRKIWKEGFFESNGTIGSTDRPPNALSERLTSTRCSLSIRESQMAERAVGISVIRRPVKMSAKSATCGRVL